MSSAADLREHLGCTHLTGGRAPRVEARATACAPLRISLAGGGTDVPPLAPGIGGRVVCAALGLSVRATVEPFERGWVSLEGAWGLADIDPWHALPSGASPAAPPLVATFKRRAQEPPATDLAFRLLEAVRASFGVEDGVHISIASDLTPGTGLGGSAAAAVSLLAAFRAAIGQPVPPQELATHASTLEREALGLRCGLQDQLCSAEGGILDLRFFDDGFQLARLPVSPALLRDLTAGLLLLDTRVRRVSGEVLDIANHGPAAHTSAELIAAADDTARGFRLGSLPLILAGMRRSAAAKLRRGGPGALPLDWIRKLTSLGAIVVRACGAGGGGHVLVWAEPARHPELLRAVLPCVVRRPSLGAQGVTLLG